MEPETIAAGIGVGSLVRRVFDDVFEVVAGEFEKLFKYRRRLGLVEWAHFCEFVSGRGLRRGEFALCLCF